MIRLDLPLIGPALETAAVLRAIPRTRGINVLLHGEPGVAKSHLLDLFALELTGSKHAIETVNGQSVSVDLVRQWRHDAAYGNLFSDWTVKRIDELDRASDAAQAELLSWLDYLPKHLAVLATTNNFGAMSRVDRGRLQRRFKQIRVEAPTVLEAVPYLMKHFGLPLEAATEIARQAVPDGELDGVNMGAAVEDAEAFLAAIAA